MPTINRKAKTQKVQYKHEAKEKWIKYYNSKAWKTLRQAIMLSHPLCEECALKGISRPAEDLHHVIPFSKGTTEDERWRLLLDPNNIECLCERCHYEKHKMNCK